MLKAYLQFHYKNYLRQHRYIREIIAVIIFNIFFSGFLYGDQGDDAIWTVFSTFAILINLITAPSLFFLEKGNTLYFLLNKPFGRRHFYISKIIFIVLVDLSWVAMFSIIYGVRFISTDYFVLLPVRLVLVFFILLLSTLLISFSFSYRPGITWLIFLLLILGSIVNKISLFPLSGVEDVYKLLVFFLPPFLELIFLAVSLTFSKWQILFSGVGLVQIVFLGWLSFKLMLHKDFY